MGDKNIDWTQYTSFIFKMKSCVRISLLFILFALASTSAKPRNGKEVKNEVSCTTCKILVHAITNYMTDPANEAALGDSLRQICSLLFANDPTTFGECDAWIVEYTDDIIELLVNQYLDPEQVCTAIEFCP